LIHLPLVQRKQPQEIRKKLFKFSFVFAAIFLSLAVKTHSFSTHQLIFWSANSHCYECPSVCLSVCLSVCRLVVYSLFWNSNLNASWFPSSPHSLWGVSLQFGGSSQYYFIHAIVRICLFSHCCHLRCRFLYCTWKIVIRIGNVFKLTFISVRLFCLRCSSSRFCAFCGMVPIDSFNLTIGR